MSEAHEGEQLNLALPDPPPRRPRMMTLEEMLKRHQDMLREGYPRCATDILWWCISEVRRG